MPPTDEDVILIGAQVDLAQFQTGMNEMSATVGAKSKQMSTDFNVATQSANQLGTAVGKMGAAGGEAAIEELRAQIKAMQVDLEQANAQIAALEAKLAEMPRRGTHQITEARHAIHGMAEEIGVHVPRFVQSFIASLEGVGPMLASAFSVVAIIGIVQILPELIEGIANTARALGGLDAEGKKAYDELIAKNRELYLETLKQAEAHRNLNTVGVTGLMKLTREHDNAKETVKQYGVELIKAFQGQQQLVNHLEELKKGSTTFTDWISLGTTLKANIEDTTKGLENQTKIVDALEKKLRDLKEEEEKRHAAVESQKITDYYAAQAAQLDAEKRVTTASLAFQIQSAKERQSIGQITQNELTNQLRDAEETRYTLEQNNIKRRMDLARSEEAATGQNAAPKLKQLEGEKEALEVEHQAKMSAIKTEGDAKILAETNAVNVALAKANKTRIDADVNAEDAAAKQKLAIRQISIGEETKVLLDGEQKRFEAEKKVREAELVALRTNAEKNKAAIITAEAELDALTKQNEAKKSEISAAGAQRELEEKRRVLQEEVRAEEESANKTLQLQRTIDDGRLQAHQITLNQWYQSERSAIETWFNEQKAALDKQLHYAEITFGKESVEYKKMLDKENNLEIQHDIEIEKLNNKMAEKFKQTMKKMTDDFNNAIAQWATGHETFAKAFMNLEDQMAQTFIKNLLKMMEQMLIAELMHKSAMKTEIMGSAKTAAANTYKSISAIPVVGPFLAPPAAAAAFAAVMAFGSFDRGGVVGEDMMGMVHKREMVLDPSLSIGLQNLIKSGKTSGAGHTINMGGVNIHNHGGSPQQTEEELAKMFHRAARKGLITVG